MFRIQQIRNISSILNKNNLQIINNCNSILLQNKINKIRINNDFKFNDNNLSKRQYSTSNNNNQNDNNQNDNNQNDKRFSFSNGINYKVAIGIFSAIMGGSFYLAVKNEKLNDVVNDNEEFQEIFNSFMDWINENIDKDNFSGIDKEFKTYVGGQGYRLDLIYNTITSTTIGHAQPETFNNIERVLSTLTKLSDKNQQISLVYDILSVVLSEFITDCGELEKVVPLISKLAMNPNIETHNLVNITRTLVVMAREEKYRDLLIVNQAVTIFRAIINRISYSGINADNYALFDYLYATNDLVNHVGPNTLPFITEEERRVIYLCIHDLGSKWTNRWIVHLVNYVPALLFSLPAYSLPLALSLPSIASFGVFFTILNAGDYYYSTSIGIRAKSDSRQTRVLFNTINYGLPFVGILAALKYPLLLKPTLGFALGHFVVQKQLISRKPYTTDSLFTTMDVLLKKHTPQTVDN